MWGGKASHLFLNFTPAELIMLPGRAVSDSQGLRRRTIFLRFLQLPSLVFSSPIPVVGNAITNRSNYK